MIDENNAKKDKGIDSEFKRNGYQSTILYDRISQAFAHGDLKLDLLSFDLFNNRWNSSTNVTMPFKSFQTHKKPRYSCLLPYTKDTFVFDVQEEIIGEAYKYVNILIKYAQWLERILQEKQSEYSAKKEVAEKLVKSFQELSSQAIFRLGNPMLESAHFRYESDFLSLLLCPSELDGYQNENRDDYYRYDLIDPFVCESLLRIMNQYEEYQKSGGNHTKLDILSGIRNSIFIRKAERSFQRFLYSNRKTYHLSLNRLMNMLIACPYSQVSSLETIKPIRLREKICTGIRNQLAKMHRVNSDDKTDIHVCIIGHTDPSYNCDTGKFEERELNDLATSILEWMESYNTHNEDALIRNVHVSIVNYYNKADVARILLSTNEEDFYNGENFFDQNYKNEVTIQAKAIDYESFAYSTLYFQKKILSNNDLIFLIDCPFLTDENFEIKRNQSLKGYCSSLESDSVFSKTVSLDSSKTTEMMHLNSQYNRIMASNTRDAGDICRVFHNHWAEAIERGVQNNKYCDRLKVVYLFSSEKDGLAYSTLASNPVNRVEKYEGKSFNIFRFANYSAKPLPILSNPDVDLMRVEISLWKMLKYASIEYAYNNFKSEINRCFWGEDTTREFKYPIHYYGLYTSIFVIIEEAVPYRVDHKFQLSVSLKIDKNHLKSIVCSEMGNDDMDEETIESFVDIVKNRMSDYVLQFVKNMYAQVYFPRSERKHFGDDLLREAFCMNIYSACSDLWGMWFWHQYRKACEACENGHFESLKKFEVQFNETVEWKEESEDHLPIKNGDSIRDSFMDKKLYDFTMYNLDRDSDLDFSLKSLLYRANEYFQYEGGDGPKLILSNLLKMYDRMVGGPSNFRNNCRIALDEW